MPPDPLPYGRGERRSSDRAYAIALLVLALLYGWGAVSLFLTSGMPTMEPSAKWALQFSAAICVFVVVLIVATLAIRAKSDGSAARIWTKAFNIFLLFAFPL